MRQFYFGISRNIRKGGERKGGNLDFILGGK